MKIELLNITIGEVCEGYFNDDEEGVVGYDERLNIRPKYQREFVYDDKKRNEVIRTIRKGLPLNVMYWCKTENEDGEEVFEVLDGQQRTISFCEYVDGSFSVDDMYFYNLPSDQQKQILDYELFVYVCEGTESERLEWFKIINIAGEKLTDQELRNAVYAGAWLNDAKRHFSKTNCPAYQIGKDYLSGSPIRQDYLEKTLDWISGSKIESYMSQHQHDRNANELWLYFRSVVSWVEVVFPKYRREMKGLDWGRLYNEHKDENLDAATLEEAISELMTDEEVNNKKGIYEYLLTGEEKFLNLRAFPDSMKRAAYENQSGICPRCGQYYDIEQMEGDHITPWCEGGKTEPNNCQMLCKRCNREKSNH